MDKLKMHSLNKVADHITQIGKLFPNCITECKNSKGETEYSIDFETLKQELSPSLISNKAERYQFTWPDKRNAILLANSPINKTLRPCKEESVNFDSTQNLYIEGDNLEVLKLLQETYLSKVKMIYIDPPYNTGNDFVYEDDFSQSAEDYRDTSGDYDNVGNRLVKNLDSNGRFHTDWLNMMYPRLKLAKDLLSEDGVIFISIDDNEVHNLRKICDEVFGSSCFLANFIWKRRVSTSFTDNNISEDHEHVIAYRKDQSFSFLGFEKNFSKYSNPDNDPRGPWISDNLTVGMSAAMRPNQAYDLVDPKTGKSYPYNPNRVWAFIPESMNKMIAENRIIFPKETTKRPMQKRFKNELKKSSNPFSSILIEKVGLNTEATRQIQDILNYNVFNYSKPLSLLYTLIQQSCNHDSIILDFFSGSATTAHAVMQLNAEDEGNRKYIMVQIPEPCDEKSEAFKAGYKNICEIGKERIRRAGKKIIEENQGKENIEKLDTGFRVLKVDSSNMKDVYYTPQEYSEDLFDTLTNNIKEDRTPEDLLFQIMLDLGIELSSSLDTIEIDNKRVFSVAHGFLMACFDETLTEMVITKIAKETPVYFVMRDSSLASDSVATNFEQIFATYSPDTILKIL